jgi:hypothetical protein
METYKNVGSTSKNTILFRSLDVGGRNENIRKI